MITDPYLLSLLLDDEIFSLHPTKDVAQVEVLKTALNDQSQAQKTDAKVQIFQDQNKKILVLVDNLEALNKDHNQMGLLEKILSAKGINLDIVAINSFENMIDGNIQSANTCFKSILCFGKHDLGFSCKNLTSPHNLAALMHNVEAKKEFWNQLKNFELL